MAAILRWILGMVIAVAAVFLAVLNREGVSLTWSPLHEPLEAPLFVMVLGFLLAGFILGGFLVWLNGASVRRERRRQRKTIDRLETEVEKLKAELTSAGVKTDEEIARLSSPSPARGHPLTRLWTS